MASNADATDEPALCEAQARRLRDALASFPTGVVIATAWHAETGALGMTMNSFTSVSLQPPLIMFSIDRRAASLPAWLHATGYAVNVLASDQEHLSNRFARALTSKWEGVKFAHGLYDAPLLDAALACFECSSYRQFDGGDHVIFLGRVERFTCDGAASPLVFHRGRYGTVAARPEAMTHAALPAGWPLSIHY